MTAIPPSDSLETISHVGKSSKRGQEGAISGRRVRQKTGNGTALHHAVTNAMADYKGVEKVLAHSSSEVKRALQTRLEQKGVLTAEDVTSCLLKDMEARLLDDIRRGNVLVTDDGEALKKKYLSLPEAFSSKPMAKTIQTIQNKAIIEQEILKVERKLASRQGIVEKMFIEQVAKTQKRPPSPEQVQQAQIATLRDLQRHAATLNPHELYRGREMAERQFTAHLKLLGLDDETVTGCAFAIESLAQVWQRVEETCKTFLEKEFADVPNLSRTKIIQWAMDDLHDHLLHRKIARLGQDYSPSAFMRLKSALSKEQVENEIRACSNHLASDPMTQFIRKWAGHLQQEIVQGIPDPGVDLGIGVCWALVNRWVAQTIGGAPLANVGALIKHLKLDSIEARDRFNQIAIEAQLTILEQKKTTFDQGVKELARLEEPLFGIRDVQSGFCKEGLAASTSSPARLKSILQRFFAQETKMVQAHEGAARLALYGTSMGHSVFMHYQPNKTIFRIIDPNYGLFQLASKAAFFECLTDLVRGYPWADLCQLICFYPKK